MRLVRLLARTVHRLDLCARAIFSTKISSLSVRATSGSVNSARARMHMKQSKQRPVEPTEGARSRKSSSLPAHVCNAC